MKLIVGTRGSKLALAQTKIVINDIKEKVSGLKIRIKIIETLGDKFSDQPLQQINEKGIFEKSIDKSVIEGKVDFAVHSMKDVPVFQPYQTIISAVPTRASPYDVLISRDGLKLMDLPKYSVIGTGSIRRKAQLSYARSDLKFKAIRGNVETRIKKFKHNDYDAIVLAEAGLERLHMEEFISERLSLEDFTPAPGQGALAVVAKKDNDDIIEILKHINHESSMNSQIAERALMKELGGGCRFPLGAYVRIEEEKLSIIACVLSPDGNFRIKLRKDDITSNPEEFGIKSAQEIKEKGKESLFKNISDIYENR